ncbi:hypothetical protein EVAR_94261_1 [Eumeta japonica]|uniref:Uncharacterized protein n=1 Tax=Eumeta variegata TaxID=151549 RepID=A0A4C1UFS3_EUMVA|nr:hypothetical protein EVAR_94261_1 [Eumeta japonica]
MSPARARTPPIRITTDGDNTKAGRPRNAFPPLCALLRYLLEYVPAHAMGGASEILMFDFTETVGLGRSADGSYTKKSVTATKNADRYIGDEIIGGQRVGRCFHGRSASADTRSPDSSISTRKTVPRSRPYPSARASEACARAAHLQSLGVVYNFPFSTIEMTGPLPLPLFLDVLSPLGLAYEVCTARVTAPPPVR